MSRGIDVGTSQRNLNFELAESLGYSSCYVKLGGDNVGRYVAPYYSYEVTQCRLVGMRVGHYWVPNANYDPIAAANYYVDNLRGWTKDDFAVLDNESLDGARLYSDAQAAAWVNRVRTRLGCHPRQVKVYLGLSDARSHSWSSVLATGCDFIIAAYSYSPFMFAAFASIPTSRIKGHQFSSSGNIGGVITDLNDWKADAFTYGSSGAGTGTTPLPAETRRKKHMTTGYWTKRSDGKVNWALAGDGPGRAAWINVPTQTEANALAAVHGDFVYVSPSRFDGLRNYYFDPAKVEGFVSTSVPLIKGVGDPRVFRLLGDGTKRWISAEEYSGLKEFSLLEIAVSAIEAIPDYVPAAPVEVGNVTVSIDPAVFDVQPVVDAIKALPAEYLVALKAAL